MSDSSNSNRAYLAVGISFLAVAAAMWLAMDSWVLALPFAASAITFIILGTRPATPPETDEKDAGLDGGPGTKKSPE